MDQLEHSIAALSERIGRAMQRWLALVAEFDRRGGAREAGFPTTAEWLAWRCGIGPRAARDHVRVARGLRRLPLVSEAFAAGRLSYSKVRALTRASAGEDEERLLELAETSTAAQLERAVRSLRTAPSADLDVANRGHDRRYLDWWWEIDGSLCFSGRLGADDGAALQEAIDTAAEALRPSAQALGDAADVLPRPPRGARRADALAEIVHSGCPRAQVVLHVDAPALACTADSPEGRAGEVCALRDGPAVASETARRMACDAEVVLAQAAGGPGGEDYGRRRRVVSPSLRASLERRDGHCRFPGCARRHGVHAHHIEHWAHGGRTDRDNLVLLCRFHHRLVHEGGFSARRDGGRLRFHRPDGREIAVIPPLCDVSGGAVVTPAALARAA